MGNTKGYIIAEAYEIIELESMVFKYMQQGFVPQGGLAIDTALGGMNPTYKQAMIKK